VAPRGSERTIDKPAPPRVALYSHDTQGLGHVRRNSLVAAALVAADPGTQVLLLTGAVDAATLPLPPNTSVVTLPALAKTASGTYRPRSLPLPLETVISMRSEILQRYLVDFGPDLLVVDKVPLGVHGELEQALTHVRSRFDTRAVLGLRDVLDRRRVAVREWEETRANEVISRRFDAVWVYGDPTFYDPAREYDFPESVRRKIAYTGYLGRGRRSLLAGPRRAERSPAHRLGGRFVLGLVGGGEDGAMLCRAFAGADFPEGYAGVLITGPFLDDDVRRELLAVASVREDLTVLDFVADVPAFISRSRAAVAMAGYNTVCELLASGQPILLSPRTAPRREQAVRAKRLRRAGLADVVAGPALTPQHLSGWFAEAVGRARRTNSEVDLNGLARVPELAGRLLGRSLSGLETESDDVAV